jgi:hypothetical protein
VAIIISRVANALIADVAVRAAPSRSVQGRTMNRYRRRYGGLWVGGRLTLSDTDIQFHPNLINRGIQSGQLDIEISLHSIESVEVLPGVLTKIIAVRAGGQLTKFRCFGARKVAEHIRAAARTAGGHDE